MIAALVGCLAGFVFVVALTPMIVGSTYNSQDWTRLAAIGETYGAASAVLGATAVVAVIVSLLLQHRQFKYTVKLLQRERTRETVKLAIEDPQFGQCWGARVAPAHIDERLFYYTNFVVLGWYYAWEDRLLDAHHARAFIQQFFDSEVPRMFWERHGDWHRPKRAWTRRARFAAMMNEEYLRAIKAGPPSRAFEPSGAISNPAITRP